MNYLNAKLNRKAKKVTRRFVRRMKQGEDIRRCGSVSKDAYNQYDNSEIVAFESGSRKTLFKGKYQHASYKEIRLENMQPIIHYTQELLKNHQSGTPLKILEVGCGNGTNIKILKDYFRDCCIEFSGIDVATERIEIGKKHWGKVLEDVNLHVASATDLSIFSDNTFDLVYSVHCLEQIPYRTYECVQEMACKTCDLVIFVEPVFEFSDHIAQKLYTYLGDQCRVLLPAIEESELRIIEKYKSQTLSNILNQTGIVITQKDRK